MRLLCLSRYENKHLAYNAGETFEVSDTLYRFLMNDSPASFTEVKEEPAEEPRFDVPDDTKVIRQRRQKP